MSVQTAAAIVPFTGFAEPLSSFLHLGGAVLFLLMTPSLIRRGSGTTKHRNSLIIFAFSCVALLSFSGVYHMLAHHGLARVIFQRLDHSAIFVLIAATFTPLHVMMLDGIQRTAILWLVWGLAAIGIMLTTFFHTLMPEWVSLVFYISLGWLGVFSAFGLYKQHGGALIKPLLYGGLLYTIGSVLEFLHTPILIPHVFGPHELFHIAVLGGISFHWALIHRCAGLAQISESSSR